MFKIKCGGYTTAHGWPTVARAVEQGRSLDFQSPWLVIDAESGETVWRSDHAGTAPPAGGGDTFVTKDSGEREEWETGSRRDSRAGRGRFDLLSPVALRRLAQLYERGAVKYGDRNWEKGQPLSRYLDSAIRHLFTYLEGDRAEDHITAAAWNCMAFVHTEERIKNGQLPGALMDLDGKRPAVLAAEPPLVGDPA